MSRALIVSVLVSFAVPVFAQTPPTTLYVFTRQDPSGLVALEDTSKDRLAAVADMKKRLAKNPAVQIVETPEAATVTVEVTSAGMEWTREGVSTTTYVGGGKAVTTPPTKTPEAIGRASITSGTFETTIESSLGPFGRSYGENLARKFEDWFKKNQKALTK